MFCNAPALAVHTAQDTAAAWATGSAGSFKAQSLRENCYTWSRGELASLLCPSWPCSPCLPDHPRRNWPQDPLHHSQVLAVVMCLRERNIKERHVTDSSCSTSTPGYSPVQNPLLGNTLVISTRLQGWREPPSVPEAPGCTGQQPASSFISCEVAIQHTVLT